MENKTKLKPYFLIAFLFLVNPNIHIMDFFPDFIAYFIFAKMLEKPSLMAPYFEEARSSALKLAWLSLGKIPAFLIAVYIRSNNTLDNDVYAMLSLIFAIAEIILTVIFIRNVASALFHLGERTNAESLITPFPLNKNGKRDMRPEDLKGFTIFFAVTKALCYTLPELLLLSRTANNGTITASPLSRFYPITLSFALILELTLGVIWFIRTKRYVRTIINEGEFENALNTLAREGVAGEFETKKKLSTINKGFFYLSLASVFTIKLAWEGTDKINIFPAFIFAFFALYALIKLSSFTERKKKSAVVSASILSVIAVLNLIFNVKFHDKYDFYDIIGNKAAKASYTLVIIFTTLEFLAFLAFVIFLYAHLSDFIKNNTGVLPTDPRYSRTEKEYHEELIKKTKLLSVFAVITSLFKLIDALLYISPKTVISDVGGVGAIVTGSSLPWFGIVNFISAAVFIGYAFYYSATLKEEVKLKFNY